MAALGSMPADAMSQPALSTVLLGAGGLVAIDGETAQTERRGQIRRVGEREKRHGIDGRTDVIAKQGVEHDLRDGV